MKVLGVNFDRSSDLIAGQGFSYMMDQVCKHRERQRTHRLVDGQAVADQCPLIQQSVNLRQEGPPEVEVDDMPNSHQELFSSRGSFPRTVLQQPHDYHW